MGTGAPARFRSKARILSRAAKPVSLDDAKKPAGGHQFARSLLAWYSLKGRSFPWRTTADPYRVLVAEIFLQKTQASQVLPIYRRFLRRFPTPKRLARASRKDILAEVWSLGLPARAAQLQRLARTLAVRFGGRVPCSEAELLSLEGVGRYTANAVLCFALSQRRAVVDANVIRVLSRYFALTSRRTRPREDRVLWATAERLVPKTRFRDYNWAIFDFAALICQARTPKCGECFLRRGCRFYRARRTATTGGPP